MSHTSFVLVVSEIYKYLYSYIQTHQNKLYWSEEKSKRITVVQKGKESRECCALKSQLVQAVLLAGSMSGVAWKPHMTCHIWHQTLTFSLSYPQNEGYFSAVVSKTCWTSLWTLEHLWYFRTLNCSSDGVDIHFMLVNMHFCLWICRGSTQVDLLMAIRKFTSRQPRLCQGLRAVRVVLW